MSKFKKVLSTFKATAASVHRNGVSGTPFKVVLFKFTEDGVTRNMVGIQFQDDDGTYDLAATAVLDVDMLKAGEIEFAGGNSWRGDHFADDIKKA